MFFFFNDYKNELLEAYEIPHIRELAESDVFYYQKAKTKFDEFSKYDISSIVIPSLLAGTKQTSFSFERWLNSYNEESAEYKLLLLIGQVVSYFDTNAAMKNKLNEYGVKERDAVRKTDQGYILDAAIKNGSVLKFRTG